MLLNECSKPDGQNAFVGLNILCEKGFDFSGAVLRWAVSARLNVYLIMRVTVARVKISHQSLLTFIIPRPHSLLANILIISFLYTESK